MKYCSVQNFNSPHCTHIIRNSTSSKSCPLFPSQRLKSPSSNFIITTLAHNLTLPSLGRRKGQQPIKMTGRKLVEDASRSLSLTSQNSNLLHYLPLSFQYKSGIALVNILLLRNVEVVTFGRQTRSLRKRKTKNCVNSLELAAGLVYLFINGCSQIMHLLQISYYIV